VAGLIASTFPLAASSNAIPLLRLLPCAGAIRQGGIASEPEAMTGVAAENRSLILDWSSGSRLILARTPR
jgi:hypothetical protein